MVKPHDHDRYFVPVTAERFERHILDGNIAFAEMRRVPQDQRLRFAIAAYNCGPGNAMKGLANGGVDSRTAGHDYSADVLARQEAVARFLARHSVPA